MATRNTSKEAEKKKQKKQKAKEYETYVKQFTPKPKYVQNGVKAFVVGGLICMGAYGLQSVFADQGMGKEDAGTAVTILLICGAQLLTGFGWFDTIAKYTGAGVIVPITGFANSMVSPAMEYKKEGPVLGAGAKLFTLAGPVLVLGITASVLIGILKWAFQ